MGGIGSSVFLWIGTSALAAFLAQDSVLEILAPAWTALCICGFVYIIYLAWAANATAREKRAIRNAYLVEEVNKSHTAAVLPRPGTREVDPKIYAIFSGPSSSASH